MRLAFIAIVIAPTLVAAVYYSLLASPRYVSEAQFLVRGVSTSRIGGLTAFFRTFGISRAVDDANIVENYVISRDAVRALEARLPLREIFGRPEGDVFSRFPRFWENDSFEKLYEYYLRRVSVVADGAQGISSMKVETFRSEDSTKIARELLLLAEDLVNRMNTRAQADAVSSAQSEVTLAEAKIVAAQADLTAFRNRALLVDPSKNAAASL